MPEAGWAKAPAANMQSAATAIRKLGRRIIQFLLSHCTKTYGCSIGELPTQVLVEHRPGVIRSGRPEPGRAAPCQAGDFAEYTSAVVLWSAVCSAPGVDPKGLLCGLH